MLRQIKRVVKFCHKHCGKMPAEKIDNGVLQNFIAWRKDNGQLTDADLARIDEYGFPQDWKGDAVCYDLKHNPAMSDLSERLVIDWGLGALAWVQCSDKPVLEIRRPNSIGNFCFVQRS